LPPEAACAAPPLRPSVIAVVMLSAKSPTNHPYRLFITPLQAAKWGNPCEAPSDFCISNGHFPINSTENWHKRAIGPYGFPGSLSGPSRIVSDPLQPDRGACRLTGSSPRAGGDQNRGPSRTRDTSGSHGRSRRGRFTNVSGVSIRPRPAPMRTARLVLTMPCGR